MAVRIRMKRLGRRHRPFYRVCAMDARTARDGRVIEELGTYDPMIKETDARATLDNERIDYWLSVGAQPSENVAVLLKKYGTNGTHLDAQAAAQERLQTSKPTAPPPVAIPKPEEEKPEEESAEAAADEAAAEGASEAPAAEAPAEEPKAEEPKAEEPKAEEPKAEAPAEEPKAEAEAEEPKAEGEGES